jgi:hypothetical protein
MDPVLHSGKGAGASREDSYSVERRTVGTGSKSVVHTVQEEHCSYVERQRRKGERVSLEEWLIDYTGSQLPPSAVLPRSFQQQSEMTDTYFKRLCSWSREGSRLSQATVHVASRRNTATITQNRGYLLVRDNHRLRQAVWSVNRIAQTLNISVERATSVPEHIPWILVCLVMTPTTVPAEVVVMSFPS